MTATPHPSRLAEILEGLMTLASTVIPVFVKNPAHHDSAVNTLNALNQVAVSIAGQLAAEEPPVIAPVAAPAPDMALTPVLETGTPADPGHTEA